MAEHVFVRVRTTLHEVLTSKEERKDRIKIIERLWLIESEIEKKKHCQWIRMKSNSIDESLNEISIKNGSK